ncbi:hypothetical protein Celal_0966 [Cellulophaga algicola DSM 14237]|uniref:Uncharacterized protein n=1 Tax=Cellulophaga algicola (strain DSM 14237 / IC166 / ACAM 630) TaxID=688270 RepID=E6X4J1_CELAD|nr:hypothetical protein Celal_0966 [Cellulophaga algicola DSM 14237]
MKIKNIYSLKEKPHIILWFFAALCFVIYSLSYFFNYDSTIDINYYDTYYVISKSSLLQAFGYWFFVCGIGYFLLKYYNKRMFSWLSRGHLLMSLLAFTLLLLEYSTVNFLSPSKRFYEITVYPDTLNYLGILLFIIAQITYFIHILLSVFRK